jgi:hypothetical protein
LSTHKSVPPQSLENVQVFVTAVHAPAVQMLPLPQSVFAVHGQGPFVPPHASQVLETQTPESPQSLVVVH